MAKQKRKINGPSEMAAKFHKELWGNRERLVTVCFSFPEASFEADLLAIAARHYSGGAPIPQQSALSTVARGVLIQWLQERVGFPPLPMTLAKYPLERLVERRPYAEQE